MTYQIITDGFPHVECDYANEAIEMIRVIEKMKRKRELARLIWQPGLNLPEAKDE